MTVANDHARISPLNVAKKQQNSLSEAPIGGNQLHCGI